MAVSLAPASQRQAEMLGSNADITIIGGAAGSGKSYILNLIPLRYVHDPEFACVVFRRTTKQLRGQGGMWQTAKTIYRSLPVKHRPSFRETDLTVTFPSGASIAFCHLEHEKNAEDHQGLQYSLELFDELTHFTWYQFEYLMSRLRSGAEMSSRIVGSCNPDCDSWVLPLVEWWLDEDGYPDDAKRGKIRYFVRRNNEFIWGDTEEELQEYCEEVEERPLSLEFIAATIYDNPPCMKANPGYLSFLKGLNTVEKARLLDGNWYARPEGSNYFDRKWLKQAERLPTGCTKVRAWDKASTKPSDVNPYPDFSACIGMAKSREGEYYIYGNFHPDVKDEKLKLGGKFRELPGTRDNLILKQAQYDGKEVRVIMPVDPGSAGKTEFLSSKKKLLPHGIIVKKDPKPPNAAKLTRYEPFSAACEDGLVHIVESSFPDKATLEAFYKENEAFDGERSGKLRKDDWSDSCASAFNFLAEQKVHKVVNRNQQTTKTIMNDGGVI